MTQRILIAAENTSRVMGGEAILPYHSFRILRARSVDVHLVVHERSRTELLELFPDDHNRLHFVRGQTLQKMFFRLSRAFPRRLAENTFGLANNLLTQRAQRSVLRALIAGPTVIHQPIPVSPRFPSWLSGLGAPLVIGPLNGGMEYPPAFQKQESLVSRCLIAFGRSLSNLMNGMVPGKREAAVVLVANARTRAALPSGIRGQILELPENAVDLREFSPSVHEPEAARFLFVGRLVDWKALNLLLEAMTHVPAATLDVIGNGPMLVAWHAQAEALGLGTRVRFLGFLPQSACAEHLARATALVLPSLYECGGAVVLEAMSMGRPVIATDWGGPSDYLDPGCGILIAPSSRSALIAGFAQAMQSLIDDPAHASVLGLAGRERLLEHFDWEKRVDTLLSVYARCLE